MSEYASFQGEEGGHKFTIESNTSTSERMAETLKTEPAKAEPEKVEETEVDLDPSETTPDTGKQPKRPRDDPKARVAEATRIAAEARKKIDEVERRAKAAESELARFRASQTQPQTQPEPIQTPQKAEKNDGRPKLDDFDSIEDHAEAMAEWVAEKKEKARAEAAAQRSKADFQESRVKTFGEKLQNHTAKDPTFWDRMLTSIPSVVNSTPSTFVGPSGQIGPLNDLNDQVMGADDPVLYLEYLAANPEVVDRFSKLQTEAQFWKEFGKLERDVGSTATTDATVTAPEISKAAQPARPVTGGPPTVSSDPNKMSFEEYAKWQAREDEKERKRSR